MRISLIQMNGNKSRDENVARACNYIDQAATENPDLVILPEFFNTMYFYQYFDYTYMNLAEHHTGYTISKIREKAKEHNLFIVATIYEEQTPGLYYDTAMIIDPKGMIVGKYRKTHPAGRRCFEKMFFRFGSKYPVFTVKDWKVGAIICFDSHFPEAARSVALNGAELLVIPFAVPELPNNMFLNMLSTRAYENQIYVAACNKAGVEGNWEFGGRSLVIDPLGKVIAEAGSREDEIITAELEIGAVHEARKTRFTLRDRRPDLYTALTKPTEDLPC